METLGPYDALPARLSAADTVLLLDLPRALRRSKERWDFWWWLATWRWFALPKILSILAEHSNARGESLRDPRTSGRLAAYMNSKSSFSRLHILD
jgi:hypothetical protein